MIAGNIMSREINKLNILCEDDILELLRLQIISPNTPTSANKIILIGTETIIEKKPPKGNRMVTTIGPIKNKKLK